jgi:Xaa-Pro aminopeptidase
MDTRTSPIRLRITQLREELQRQGVDAVLVPSADPHLSRVPARTLAGPRVAVSGFTGSMATLVVAQDRAVLFADSRYWVQAEAELHRQRHRTGEDRHRRGHRITSTGWPRRPRAAAPWRWMARCWGWRMAKLLRALEGAGVEAAH